MELSVIVVSYNTRNLLGRCLRSAFEDAAAVDFEVVVVDNASTDGSPEMVALDFPSVKLFRNDGNIGFARACNQAIEASGAPYFLLLNSDALLVSGSLRAMLDFMQLHPSVAVVGAQLLNPDWSKQGSSADFPTLRSELLLMTKLASLVRPGPYPFHPSVNDEEPRNVDWVSGACMLVRRSAADLVGLLDESYFMYSEETDWCYRMKLGGWQICQLPSARAIHLGSESFSRAPEPRRSLIYRSKWLFFKKHRSPFAALLLLTAIRLTSSLKLLYWFLRGLAPGADRRRLSQQQVRSYIRLLAEL